MAMEGLRERWDRISPRERKLILLLGGTAIVLILYFVTTTISDGFASKESANQERRKALSALHEYRIRKSQGLIQKTASVPIGKEPIELESFLENIAKDVGITIPGYEPRPEANSGDYVEVSTRVRISGLSILELKDFLEAIETRQNRRVVVSELTVKRQFNQHEMLNVTIVVATFYKKGEEGDEEDTEEGEGS